MNFKQYCRYICKKSGSTFVATFCFFKKEKRENLEAFYAFCRLVDDCVDEAQNTEEAANALQFWKDEIPLLYQQHPRHPVSKALLPIIQKLQIPERYFEEIVLGCEMDLHKKEYETYSELDLYCYRVASSVGLILLYLFNAPRSNTLEKGGIALGKALQLTNILRDILEDLKRGRVYFPKEEMTRFQIRGEDFSWYPENPSLNFFDFLYFQIDRAKSFFNEAWENFPRSKKERRPLFAAMLMGRFYEKLLFKIEKDPLEIFSKRITLSKMEKLKIFFREFRIFL